MSSWRGSRLRRVPPRDRFPAGFVAHDVLKLDVERFFNQAAKNKADAAATALDARRFGGWPNLVDAGQSAIGAAGEHQRRVVKTADQENLRDRTDLRLSDHLFQIIAAAQGRNRKTVALGDAVRKFAAMMPLAPACFARS